MPCPYNNFLCFVDSRASDFGLMKIDNKGRILSFSEKPKGDDLKAMVIPFFPPLLDLVFSPPKKYIVARICFF